MHGESIKILIHMGATRKENKKSKPILSDETGLIAWKSDIRGIISFTDASDIEAKQRDFEGILKRWLKIS